MADRPATLTMPCVWTPLHQLHQPGGEIWMGVRYQGTELAARGDTVLAALQAAAAPVHSPGPVDRDLLGAVHDADLVSYLETAWDNWVAADYIDEPGQGRVVPYVFPIPGVSSGRVPTAMSARAGTFAFDTMTLIGPGSAEAILAATAVADTASQLVAAGAPAAYALCRPPGHHAGRRFFGGSCYLNNAAVAVARLRSTVGRVAVVDIDAHHGNGTQEIFYADPTVWYGSVHVDPGAGWFPHFVGFADEQGTGPVRAPTATCRWLLGRTMGRGWRRWRRWSPRRRRGGRRRWWCRWGSTPPPSTRRVRSRSAATGTPRRDG